MGISLGAIQKISFDDLVSYWKEVNHFQDPSKVYREHIEILGPFHCEIKNPRRQAYGLFFEGRMIGGTQIVEWAPSRVRYRTINIRKEFRGRNLGYEFLSEVLRTDWPEVREVFGWVRRDHYNWSLRHGFKEIDGLWIENHIGMLKKVPASF